MFEGSSTVMLKSLDRICSLPDSCLIWPGWYITMWKFFKSNEAVKTIASLKKKKNKQKKKIPTPERNTLNPRKIKSKAELQMIGIANYVNM